MEEVFIFVAGNLIATLSFGIGFYVGRRSNLALNQLPESTSGSIFPAFAKRKERRKPKSISEAEQWKKEQTEAPLDPGMG